jgi:hypothetical protein
MGCDLGKRGTVRHLVLTVGDRRTPLGTPICGTSVGRVWDERGTGVGGGFVEAGRTGFRRFLSSRHIWPAHRR